MNSKKLKFLPDFSPRNLRLILVFVIFIGLLSFLLVCSKNAETYITKIEQGMGIEIKRIGHRGPVLTKGIYVSGWTASEPKMMEELINLIDRTELNAIILDIKDSSGKITYNSKILQVEKLGTKEIKIRDLSGLVKKLHLRKIYIIARIPIFQDSILAQKNPALALKNGQNGQIWKDNKGLSWVDPASEEVWAYNIELAKEVFAQGFDEVNFDYIRFPSDGKISNITYPFWDNKTPKNEVIKKFFEYQNKELTNLGPTSVDLFGMTFWHTADESDMNIGQRLEDALPYFDFICPMLYPSHFPNDFNGFKNPAEHPYEIIYQSLKSAEPLFMDSEGKRIAKPKIRPWIQAFDIGAKYTPDMILKQKQAVTDGEGYGWLLWNASNNYSKIESALK
ncbi:MAG: putative glycoside hydrolase [Patescibacteria group bacterium]|jgi:hypothetical protein